MTAVAEPVTLAVSGTDLRGEDCSTQLIELARSAGVTWVEVWHTFNFVEATADRFFGNLAEAGLRVATISCPASMIADVDASRSLITSCIDAASRHGIGMVNSYFGHSVDVEDDLVSVYAQAVRPCVDRARAAGVVLLLENEFDAFGWDPLHSDMTRTLAGVRSILDRCGNAGFGWTFDAANLICAGQPLDEASIQECIGHASYVHAKDVRVANGPADPGWQVYTDGDRRYQTCPMGTGIVPWESILDALVASGSKWTVTVEPHSEPATAHAASAAAADYVRGRLCAGRQQ